MEKPLPTSRPNWEANPVATPLPKVRTVGKLESPAIVIEPSAITASPITAAPVSPPPIQKLTTASVGKKQASMTPLSTSERFNSVNELELDAYDEISTSRLSQPLPGWLISMVVHVTLILILALIPLAQEIGLPFIISVSQGKDEATQEFELTKPMDDTNDTAEEGLELTEPIVSESAVSLLETLIGGGLPTETKFTAVAVPQIETSLSGRSGQLKSTLLAAYGGNGDTENAVAEGLAWLARQQRSDGAWSLRGPYGNGGFSENKPAATAMAIIAFAGAGHHHLDGQYKTNIAKGLKYLIAQQDSDGCFATDTPDRQMMYAQGQATIALCELYGMTKDGSLRNPAQRAVDFAEAAQSDQGGWRYIPREDSDTSVTGWFVMALMSAKMAGLSTSRKTLDKVGDFLDSVRHDSGAQYGYVTSSPPFPSMSAEGLLCREYLGWERDRAALIRGCELLASEPISSDTESRSYYYWYYATQALHHFGGRPWKKWNDVMIVELPKLQVKDLKEKGSWPPQHDPYGSAGGRLYATCFAIYCLEVYYRHLPLYSLKK